MKFTELELPGAHLVEPEVIEDERGFFARSWCAREFAAQGLGSEVVQLSVSYNFIRGTIRGLHFQAPPHTEVKIVRCTRGAIFDVLVDIRPDSPMFCRWTAHELTAENRSMLYIPGGFAHGFQTLEDDTEVMYQMSEFHVPESARGVRWNDDAFGVEWPFPVTCISPRDSSYPDFRRARADDAR